MDIVKAYTFIPKDEKWISKILIGAVISLFSFLVLPIFLVYGYQLAVTRRVMKGEVNPLPEWENWGELLMDGLKIFVAIIIYALPIILLSICSTIVGAVVEDETVGTITGIVMGCVGALYGIFLAFVVPALNITYARTGDFGAMLRLGEVFAIVRENVVDILLTIVAGFVAGLLFFIIMLVSVITICGPIILTFVWPVWYGVANGHLYGQIGAKSKESRLYAS